MAREEGATPIASRAIADSIGKSASVVGDRDRDATGIGARLSLGKSGGCRVQLELWFQPENCEDYQRWLVEIIVNGVKRQAPEGLTVTQLLETMNLTGKRLAVEVNLEIVPRSTHHDHRLQTGDRVEIVHAIGGG